ncbi:signal peptidase I [Candidatus Woesearchaeota archaeon]|nr:signal peptidase I [Candidatus Woesearchaeota archaeon]
MYLKGGSISRIIVFILLFTAGFFAGDVISYAGSFDNVKPFSLSSNEVNSPFDHIKEEDIDVLMDKVVINVEKPTWARFADTNSMDPIIDKGANSIEVKPLSEKDVHIGDIVSYNARFTDGVVIHRVIDIKEDEKGLYYVMKGDNNENEDPERVRFEQLKGVVIAVVY